VQQSFEEPTNPTTLPPPSTPPATPGSTLPPGTEFHCTSDGTFRDPQNCARWHVCRDGQQFTFDCPGGLVFDNVTQTCNWPDQVQC
jgi:chitinase